MNKKSTLLFLVLLVSLLVVDNVYAQPTAPTSPVAGCFPPTTCIPIDGGIGFLAALAVGFGLKKLYSSPKTKN